MNKLTSFVSAVIIAAAMPMMAQSVVVGSTSGVSGTATETNAGVYTNSFGIPGNGNYNYTGVGGSFGSGGSQTATASFNAQTAYPLSSNDNASGSAFVTGNTTLTGSFIVGNNTATSTTWGNTNDNGNVNVNDSPSGNFSTNLSGSGSLGTSSFSFIGTFGMTSSGSMTPINGAFAQGSTTGAFNFSALGGSGWTGSGSTTQWTTSTVSQLPNGYSATTSSSVVSTACPK